MKTNISQCRVYWLQLLSLSVLSLCLLSAAPAAGASRTFSGPFSASGTFNCSRGGTATVVFTGNITITLFDSASGVAQLSNASRTFSGCYNEFAEWNFGHGLTSTDGNHWIHESHFPVDSYYFDLQVAPDGKSITGTYRDVQHWPDGSHGEEVGVLNLPLAGTCPVPSLSTLTGLAKVFEDAAPNAPGFSLIAGFNGVDPPVDERIALLQSAVGEIYGFVPPRTSGFRPPEYQKHFFELREKLKAVRNELTQNPNNAACQELEANIMTEIDLHDIPLCRGNLPCVNPPGSSLHERNPSLAVDLGNVGNIVNTAKFRGILNTLGIAKPPARDLVHFRLDGSVDPRSISVVVASPINVLVHDPLGRRIGFDPGSQMVVNEIGSDAFYTGPGTEPQVIDIGRAAPGAYVVRGIGTGTGPYTITFETRDGDANVLDERVITGVASPGVEITPIINEVPITLEIDIKPDDTSNVLNRRAKGAVPIAILSTAAFDTRTVDSRSVRINSSPPVNCRDEDVNNDGVLDLMCHVGVSALSIPPDAVGPFEVKVKARTYEGQLLEGFDVADILK